MLAGLVVLAACGDGATLTASTTIEPTKSVVTAATTAADGSTGAATTGSAATGSAAASATAPAPAVSESPKKPKNAKQAGHRPARKAAPVALAAGNPAGHASVPAAARAVPVAHPAHVIGHGSPTGCTSAAVLKAVAAGGVTTFDCGPKPVTITLSRTAKVVNAHPDVVLDGGGLVTLSGSGRHRILYQNTCDQAQGWTTAHCDDQEHPRLTLQHLTFADGNATGQKTDGGGGGAVFVRGGRLTVVDSVFVRNTCDRTGPDLGGAAIRVLDQAGDRPVYVSGSTFGGAPGQGGRCSNGGALSSIGVSWVVLNSLFRNNSAIGDGANPQKAGTPGGGSGGAIYTDGNTYTVTLAGSRFEDNHAREGGGAVFFVSNDRTGSLKFTGTVLRRNPSDGFETQGYRGVFYLGRSPHPTVINSSLS